MSKIAKLIGSLGTLAGIENAKRIDRQNTLVFHDELKGGTVFDRIEGEKGRSDVLFRGFPDTHKVNYLRGLVRLAEIRHYQSEDRASIEEILEANELEARLEQDEALYSDVADVMSVSEVGTMAIWD